MQKNDSGIKSNSTTHGNPDTWCDGFNDKQLKLDHLLQVFYCEVRLLTMYNLIQIK